MLALDRSDHRFRPLVLCYHAVSDTWERPLCVTPAAFEQQIRHVLRRGYAPATALETLSGADKVFHVTFDDAFRNIRAALDILTSLGVPATVFAVSRFADDGRPFDAGTLARVESTPQLDAERATMTWDELRAVAAHGFEIGSHTESHPHLTTLSDLDLELELRRSREQIERELGRPCPLLAYPFGDCDVRVEQAAEAAGYTAAFVLAGRQRPVNRYAIPRVGIYRIDGPRRAALKMSPLGRRAISARGSLRAARATGP